VLKWQSRCPWHHQKFDDSSDPKNQLTQPRQSGPWCRVSWDGERQLLLPGSDKAPAAIPKKRSVSDPASGKRSSLGFQVQKMKLPAPRWTYAGIGNGDERMRWARYSSSNLCVSDGIV
jgi:hypothetical protein